MIRKPVVAGQFYAANADCLRREIAGLVPGAKNTVDAIGVVSPHAGYAASGPVAGDVLSAIKPKPTYLILGPNHTGLGKPFGMDIKRAWETPFGTVETDRSLGGAILDKSDYIEEDTLCHDYEHSIEVVLPFLQYLNQDFKFVPIVVGSSRDALYEKTGKEIAEAIKAFNKPVTIIASSDMTHYEPYASAKKKDMKAIARILDLDVTGFLKAIRDNDISMCGFAPTAVMIAAAVALGAKKVELIKYNTSGDTVGDYSSVVGYAGIVIS